MKTFLLVAVLFALPTLAAPECAVVHNKICFESQASYDNYMGWGPEQTMKEIEANK